MSHWKIEQNLSDTCRMIHTKKIPNNVLFKVHSLSANEEYLVLYTYRLKYFMGVTFIEIIYLYLNISPKAIHIYIYFIYFIIS